MRGKWLMEKPLAMLVHRLVPSCSTAAVDKRGAHGVKVIKL
jgi:hypothetical protein